MASIGTPKLLPLDGGPEVPEPLPSNPALPTFQDKPGATSTPKPSATRTPRPQPSASPSVSNPRPTGVAKSAQFSPVIKMQGLGIGAGRSLSYPVGSPTTNVYHPATSGQAQPILKGVPITYPKFNPQTTLRGTVPLFPGTPRATRGRMPYVPAPAPTTGGSATPSWKGFPYKYPAGKK